MKKSVLLILLCCMMIQAFAGYAETSKSLQNASRVDLKLSGAFICADEGGIASVVLRENEDVKHVAMERLDIQKHLDYQFQYDKSAKSQLSVTAGKSVYGTILGEEHTATYLNVGIISKLSIEDGCLEITGKLNKEENNNVEIILLSECEKDGSYSDKNIFMSETVSAENGEFIAVLDVNKISADNTVLLIKHDREYAILYGIDITTNSEQAITDYVDFDLNLHDSVSPMEFTDTKKRYEQAVSELPEEVSVIEAKQYSCGIQFYVSEEGSDSNKGSLEEPFKTIEAAVSATAALPAEDKNKGVAIFIRGGYYEVDKNISINEYYAENNAALYISAYKDEEVVISGGTKLDAEEFSVITDSKISNRLISEEAQSKVLQFNLKELGIGDFSEANRNDLFINRERMPLSRYPNIGEVGFTEVIEDGSSVGEGFKIRISDTRINEWENTGDLRAYGSFAREWQKMTAKIGNLEEDILHILTNSLYDVMPKSRKVANTFYYYNVFEELDMPGEWYIDTQNEILYVYPTENFFETEIVLSVSKDRKNIIDITKSKNVIIDNINFCHIERSAVRMYECESCVVQRCEISNIGYCGVEIDKCKTSGAIENVIFDIGSYGSESSSSYGVWIGTNYSETEEILSELNLDRNFAQNNIIGSNKFFGVPMRVTHSSGNVLSHNLIHGSKGSGIRVSYCYETIVEYNEICGGPKEIWDAGAIYTGDVASTAGNHIRYNYLHDFSKEIYKDSVGVYLDELGSDTFVYGNVIVNACKGVFMHSGRQNAVVGNVIANVWENEGDAISDSINHWKSDDTAWDTKLLTDGTGLDVLLPRFDNSVSYQTRYPNIYEYLKKVKMLKEMKSSSDYVRGTFEDELKEPAYQYIASNIVIGDRPISVSELGQKTALTENNTIIPLSDYSENVFEETVGFSPIGFDRMGLTETNKISDGEIELLGSVGADEEGNYELFWKSSGTITHYEIEIASDAEFTNVIETGTTNGNGYQTVNCSEAEGVLYWRVKGYSYVENQQDNIALSDTGVINKSEIIVDKFSVTNTAVSFRLLNNSGERKSFTAYIAEYSKIGNTDVITDVTSVEAEMEAGEYVYKENIAIGGEEGEYVKIFIWDEHLEPLCSDIKIRRS